MSFCRLSAFLVFIALTVSGPALAIDAQQVNTSQPGSNAKATSEKLDPFTTKVQILLDRAHFSPGEIDGKSGENVQKALTAFAQARGTNWNGRWTPELWKSLSDGAPENLFTQYTTSDDDVNGPFLKKLPTKMEDMKDLPGLYYTSAREELAERFRVSGELLAALNPGVSFDKAGEKLTVPAVADDRLGEQVARIVVDKSAQTVEAFDSKNGLIAFYPATVGSEEKPAPSGRLKVTIAKENPTYHYDPKYHFKGVKTDKPFTIKPGPNNPVGLVWIGLTGEGYGIHGTPNPEDVSKTASHGCVRLTNWNALQLAAAVKKGTPVEFTGGDRAHVQPGGTSKKASTVGRK
jgi:lipoprotein-anchoring transpeptidase ErfK/SrfK